MKELIGQWILTSEEDDCADAEVLISSYSESSFTGSLIQADTDFSPLKIDGSIHHVSVVFSRTYIISGQKPLPIVYTGKYNRKNDILTGTWEMSEESRKVGEGWLQVSSTGTWVMKRK